MPDQLTTVILTESCSDSFIRAAQSVYWSDALLIVGPKEIEQEIQTHVKHKSLHFLPQPQPITDFAAVRNKALLQVKTPWVLFVDSDEVVTTELQAEIVELLTSSPQDTAFQLIRQDVFLGKTLHHAEWGALPLLRLAKQDAGNWQGSVHETWQASAHIKVLTLQSPLLHHAHDSVHQFISAVSRYSHVAAENTAPSSSTILLQMCLFPIGKFFWNLFILQGIGDVMRGLCYAVVMSLHSLNVRVMQYEKTHSER
jgi:hypothetical protein